MKIWVIMAQENPSQNRNGKRWRSNTLAEYLADRNHEVIRWRSSFSHQKKIQLKKSSLKEKHDNYFHQFIESRSYKRHISLKRFLNHIDLGRNFKKISPLPIPPATNTGKFEISGKISCAKTLIDTGPM